VILGVFFRRVLVMLSSVQVMAVSDLGVVGRLFMLPGLVLLCGLAMVLCSMFVVFCCLLMVFVNFMVSHFSTPGLCAEISQGSVKLL
jgi:hypothetical protein